MRLNVVEMALTQFLNCFYCSGLDESVLEECLQYLEKQLESSQVRKAMEEFFSFRYLTQLMIPAALFTYSRCSRFTPVVLPFFSSGELVQIMMATANENLSAKFCNRVLKFFTKLFQLSKSTGFMYLFVIFE